MFSNLIDSEKKELIEKLKSDFSLQERQSEKIISESGNFLKENLEDQTAENPKDILELINTGSKIKQDNRIIKALISKLSQYLNSKFDLNPDETKKVAEFLAINIIKKISEQLDVENKKIDIKDLFSFLGLGSELRELAEVSLRKPSGKFSDYPKKIF